MENVKNTLSVAKIYAFINKIDTTKDPIDTIKDSIAINSAISEEQLKNDYGLKFVRLFGKNSKRVSAVKI